jgi:L-ribulokinase
MNHPLVIGLDYGTDSVRAVLINTGNGDEIASSVINYPRWREGRYCNPSLNQFRQHPLDYLEGLKSSIQQTLIKAPDGSARQVIAISIDTTGSTPIAVDQEGTALALRDDFKDNPNAMFILWKDHTAVKEAVEINEIAKNWGGEDYTRFSGGVYSSEWYWSKIIYTLRSDESIRPHAYSWVEHCDWASAILTGTQAPHQIKRSRCAAGHKAMWHESWGGLPPEEFLITLDPLLKGLRERLYEETYTADQTAGLLTDSWADELGLPAGIPVGVGAFDAHMGAVGGELKPGSMVKVVGTSTCDILSAANEEVGSKLIKGICGQVDGSALPGLVGLEAGQSAFGDVYAWFKELISWPFMELSKSQSIEDSGMQKILNDFMDSLIPRLNEAAEKIPIGESGIIAVDWFNGRRTPFANQELRGAILGLNLGSDAPRVFRALVEATAFGSKKIINQFIEDGVKITEVIAIGGVAKKSPFVMQTIADVFNMKIKVAKSEQTVALGAAMFAAVVGGVFKTLEEAQAAMGSGFETVYEPIADNVKKYQVLFEQYEKIGTFIEEELTPGSAHE